MLKPAALSTTTQYFLWVPIVVTLFVAACSTSPQTFRLEAEKGDLLGFPEGATAVRGASRWSVERRVYTYGQTRHVKLSREESLALDAALANPALYAVPVARSDNDCIDVSTTVLDIVTDSGSRRLVLECETSPVLEDVLGILFDWPRDGGSGESETD